MVGLPTESEVRAWLRARVRKPLPGRIARWLGESSEFHYRMGPLVPIEMRFFRRHSLFTAHGERGLLPFVALPSGSWGIFATDGASIRLLRPDDSSVGELLRAEGRPLDEAPPAELSKLIADVMLRRKRAYQHILICGGRDLRDAHLGRARGLGTYAVDEDELGRVEAGIVAPTLDRNEDGEWRLAFTTVWGWAHDLQELGIERVTITGDWVVDAMPRTVLSKRIFRHVPKVIY